MDNVIATEKPDACLVQFGGQTAIKLAKHMDEIGLPIWAPPPTPSTRPRTGNALTSCWSAAASPRPEGRTVFTLDEALKAAQEVGYPVLMRPSYVLGGQNMIVAYNSADVIEYMGVITAHVDMSHPVLMDKYIYGTECEVDAICDGEDYLVPGIMEQVERTGVHSGDSICVYPPYNFSRDVIDTLVDYTGRFARELKVVGLVTSSTPCRTARSTSSRSTPGPAVPCPTSARSPAFPWWTWRSAAPWARSSRIWATAPACGGRPEPLLRRQGPRLQLREAARRGYHAGPEMKSTGEVLGIAPNFHGAMLKGLIGAGYRFKHPGPGSCVIISVKDSDKEEVTDLAWKLHDYGYKIYGTAGTARYLNSQMIPCSTVRQMSGERPNVIDLLESGLVDYIITTSPHGRDPHRDSVKFRRKATELSIPCITALDTAASWWTSCAATTM